MTTNPLMKTGNAPAGRLTRDDILAECRRINATSKVFCASVVEEGTKEEPRLQLRVSVRPFDSVAYELAQKQVDARRNSMRLA